MGSSNPCWLKFFQSYELTRVSAGGVAHVLVPRFDPMPSGCGLEFSAQTCAPQKRTVPDRKTPAARPFIVANRLPVEFHAHGGWRTSPGGLVSALVSALQHLDAVWVGWRGDAGPEGNFGNRPELPQLPANIECIEVPIAADEVRGFYDGVCNGALWPLYHDAVIQPVFRDEEYQVYWRINQRFVDYVAERAPQGTQVWFHDYQLQLAPAMLRAIRPDLCIGFFLHVPFPTAKAFEALPWKESILNGLLGADVVGFQTATSAERFMDEVGARLPVVRAGRDIIVREGVKERRVEVDVFPVGPDAEQFARLAATPFTEKAARKIRNDFASPETILLGVDRLDYTKGINLRIRAVAEILKSEEFRGRDIQFIQVAMPSRGEQAAYRTLRTTVEQTLQSANAELVALGLRPIHYVYEALPTEDVVALYVAADVMLVTSLADGMNLVSKEFVACRHDHDGRLVLSRSAGAAVQLQDAWLVEASSLADLTRGIGAALRAGADETRQRMASLREVVFQGGARRWADSFLARLRAP